MRCSTCFHLILLHTALIMRTPRCRLVHFRGRYYRFYDIMYSSPDDYGSDIVNDPNRFRGVPEMASQAA